ncbi:MAG: Lrp/AsnC family transcriptional regulator [Planctomycetaceae bacterium]|nr:Lrp/AsnC family transcriptional regulator [Planctomycetaceae bacterium]
MQPDSTDWKIINQLSKNSVPNSVVARDLGLSEGAVRQRLKKLQENGILKIKALRNPETLENQELALITVNVSESKLLNQKAVEISQIENVISVAILSGRYDLLVEVLVDSNKGLIQFLTNKLSAIKGISKTETFVVLKSIGKWI